MFINRVFISYIIFIVLFAINGDTKFVWKNLTNTFAVCNDYTQAGYFISRTVISKWLIYLEGGGICDLPDNCNYRYTSIRTKLRNNVSTNPKYISTLMSSPTSFLSHEVLANIEGYSILSPSREENPTFYDFNHVLVPYCSSDLWLGMGTESTNNSNKTSLYQFVYDDTITEEHQFTFRGSFIIKSLIQDLIINENLNTTSHIYFGGSSAGGIAAIVHAKYFQQQLSSTTNFSVFGDSAWFLDFQNNFKILPGSVLSFSVQSHESCFDLSQNIPCCISASCMFNSDKFHFPKDIPVFMSFSLYDAYLLNETLSDVSRFQNRLLEFLRIISEFGGAMNTSLQTVGMNDINLSLFISSCFQHVFLVTSSLWGNDPNSLYSSEYTESLDSEFKIKLVPNIWTDYKMKLDYNIDPLKRNAINLRDALTDWHNAKNASVIFRENCKSPHCNNLCPEMIILGVGEEYWPKYVQYAIIIFVLSITLFSIFVYALLHVWHSLIRRYQKRYVDKQKNNIKKMESNDTRGATNFTIMHCLPNDTITLACHNIEYRVDISLRAAKHLEDEEECIATCVLETFDTINEEIQQTLDRKATLIKCSVRKSGSRFFDPPTPSSNVNEFHYGSPNRRYTSPSEHKALRKTLSSPLKSSFLMESPLQSRKFLHGKNSFPNTSDNSGSPILFRKLPRTRSFGTSQHENVSQFKVLSSTNSSRDVSQILPSSDFSESVLKSEQIRSYFDFENKQLAKNPDNSKPSRRYEIWKSHMEGKQDNIHPLSRTDSPKRIKNEITQNVIQNFKLNDSPTNNEVGFSNPSFSPIKLTSFTNNDLNISAFINSPLDNKMQNIDSVYQIEKKSPVFKTKYPEVRRVSLQPTKTGSPEIERKKFFDFSSTPKTPNENYITPSHKQELSAISVSSEYTDESVPSYNNNNNNKNSNNNNKNSNSNTIDEFDQNSFYHQIKLNKMKREDSILAVATTLEGMKENTTNKQDSSSVLPDIIRRNKRNIINDVSALFKPGELIAIMGPSGSGKTTLLDILAGRRYLGECKGHVFVNGYDVEEVREWFIVNSGYVLQLDQPFYQDLTVRENLTLSAITRLPSDMKLFEKLERVEEVLKDTILLDHANTKVGGASGSGLSGGQKKRLSLAVQLLKRPSLLFLDEPTSGLDASSSYELLTYLNRFAESQRTIILSIHQPRFEIFHLFTQIILLCRGQVAYHGEPSKAYETFVKAHHTFKKTRDITIPDIQKHNPADVIMDFLGSKNSRSAILAYYQLTKGSETIANDIFREQFEKRKNFGSIKDSFKKPKSSSILNRIAALESRAILRSSWTQLLYLPFVFVMYGLLLGSAYKQASEAILIISGFCVYSVASALFMFPIMYTYFGPTLKIYAQEQADGIAQAIDLIVQSFVRFVSLAFIPVTMCAIILYLFIIRIESWDPWVLFQLIVINVALNHTWIALLMCLIFIFPTIAHRISPVMSAVAGFAGGFFVPIRLMPIYYQWLFYINPNFYGFSASARIILDNLKIECAYESELECYSSSSNYTLQNFDFINVKPYRNIVILEAMTIFFIICSFLALSLRFFNFRRLFKRRTQEESEMITEFKYREDQLKYESRLIQEQNAAAQQNNKKLMEWQFHSQEQESNHSHDLSIVNDDAVNALKRRSEYVPDMISSRDSTLESKDSARPELIKSKVPLIKNQKVTVRKHNSFNLKRVIYPNMELERLSHARSLTNLGNDDLDGQMYDKDMAINRSGYKSILSRQQEIDMRVKQFKESAKDNISEIKELNMSPKEKMAKVRRNASVKSNRPPEKKQRQKYSDSYFPGHPTKTSEESSRTLPKKPKVRNDESMLEFVSNPIYTKPPPITNMAKEAFNNENFSKK